MRTVILFGGGDAGGLLITSSGIKPIPPFDPSVRQALRSTASILNAMSAARSDADRKKMAKIGMTLSNLSVELVEQVVGQLDGDRAIIYQDEDGGFTCGSTGKPPIPIPWPPKGMPTIENLVASGAVEQDMVEFLQLARLRNVKLVDAFEKPDTVAKKLGIELSARTTKHLKALAPSRVDAIKDPGERDVVRFFHRVAADGRYLDSWFREPYAVAQAIKADISDAVLDIVDTGGAFAEFTNPGGPREDNEIAVGIGWAVVCIVVGIILGAKTRPIDEVVIDQSGIAKF